MKYIIKTFNDLTPKEIHQLYKARIDVFVVEQNCPYPDVDMHDLVSIHILLLNDCDELLAYCRVLPANTTFSTPSIGRVLSQSIRIMLIQLQLKHRHMLAHYMKSSVFNKQVIHS